MNSSLETFVPLQFKRKKGKLLVDGKESAHDVRIIEAVARAMHWHALLDTGAFKSVVEIAKAVSRNARLLVMDEPTATLTPTETERLFALIAQLKAEGVTIIYISHKLDEVERVTDEIVVMRDGRFVAREDAAHAARIARGLEKLGSGGHDGGSCVHRRRCGALDMAPPCKEWDAGTGSGDY